MSHFTVAVILDKNIDEQYIEYAVTEALSPYDEGILTEPRIIKKKEDIILSLIKDQEERKISIEEFEMDKEKFAEKYGSWEARIMETFISEKEYDLTDTELFNRYVESSKNNGVEFDEEGNELTTYNENSKWDWYQIGGRWDGALFGKNYLRVKDIDFKSFRTDEEYAKEFERLEGFKKEFGTLENFIEYIKYKITFALLNSKSDEWHEPGTMGFFAMDDSTDDSTIYHIKKCHEVFTKEVEPDDWVVLVDCHI